MLPGAPGTLGCALSTVNNPRTLCSVWFGVQPGVSPYHEDQGTQYHGHTCHLGDGQPLLQD